MKIRRLSEIHHSASQGQGGAFMMEYLLVMLVIAVGSMTAIIALKDDLEGRLDDVGRGLNGEVIVNPPGF